MSLTRKEAIDEICTVFKTAWDTTGHGDRVKYDNVGKTSVPPSGQDPWVRVVIRHGTSAQGSLAGEVGTRRFRRTGLITAQVMEVKGQGLSGATDLPKIVQDAFEGVSTPGGVWFRDVAINEIGPDGDFFLTNVVAFFEYDEIK
jgi:hypothetical protein